MLARQLLAVLFAGAVFTASAQAPIKGEASAGVYNNLVTSPTTGLTSVLRVAPVGADPCASADTVKSSVTIGVTTAATTQLVALSGTTVVYVCSFVITISQVATTANTMKFVQGTGSSCGTGTADLTGTFGAGGITAAAPIVIVSGNGGGTKFKTAAGGALCVTTAIGATAFFSGVVSYVQQ